LQPREPSAIDAIAEPRGIPTISMIASVSRFRSQKSFDSRSSPRHAARFVLSMLHALASSSALSSGISASRQERRLSSDRFS
jgi:hypothetical protein